MDLHSRDRSALFDTDEPDPWTMRVLRPISLGGDATVATHAIAMLRDACASFTRVLWSAEIAGPVDVIQLSHLSPPTAIEGSAELLETWRSTHRYGSFYYRQGPSFLVIRDTRQSSGAARFVIDDPLLCHVFLRCMVPLRHNELTPAEWDAAELLAGEGLLLNLAETVVTLPLHMTRWPIPFHGI